MTEALKHHRKLYQKRVYEFHTITRELFPALELKSFLLQSEKNNLAKVCQCLFDSSAFADLNFPFFGRFSELKESLS